MLPLQIFSLMFLKELEFSKRCNLFDQIVFLFAFFLIWKNLTYAFTSFAAKLQTDLRCNQLSLINLCNKFE